MSVHYVQATHARPSRNNTANELCFLYQKGLSLIKYQVHTMKCVLFKKHVKYIKRTEKVIDLIYWLRRDLIVNINLEIKFQV